MVHDKGWPDDRLAKAKEKISHAACTGKIVDKRADRAEAVERAAARRVGVARVYVFGGF